MTPADFIIFFMGACLAAVLAVISVYMLLRANILDVFGPHNGTLDAADGAANIGANVGTLGGEGGGGDAAATAVLAQAPSAVPRRRDPAKTMDIINWNTHVHESALIRAGNQEHRRLAARNLERNALAEHPSADAWREIDNLTERDSDHGPAEGGGDGEDDGASGTNSYGAGENMDEEESESDVWETEASYDTE